MKKLTAVAAALAVCISSVSANAAIIAFEDFDGGAINLVSSNVPTLNGGPGDTFAVGSTASWPTDGGVPFSLTDNSVGAVGGTTAFPSDTEGVYGVNSNFSNQFLGISDTRNDNSVIIPPIIATWTFNIAGASNLVLNVGMGSMESSTFTYEPTTRFLFTYSIDNAVDLTAFDVTPDTSGTSYD